MKKLILPLTLILSSCGGSNSSDHIYVPTSAQPVVVQESGKQMRQIPAQFDAKTADLTASTPVPPPNSPQNPKSQDNPSSQSFLAYRYNYGFSLPAKSVAATAKSHAQICLEAGPNKCQVLNSSTSAYNKDQVSANLSLRAEPNWLDSFKSEIQSSVEAAKGDMTNNSVSAEDLTRQILDTDARLKAQTTLRDRLQRLLATRDAKLNDLLALERELARVQSQIESATTTLNVLRKRVSMSGVNINYQSQSVAVSQSALSPIGRALKGFVGGFSRGLADVINFLAAVLPWLILVIIPGLWLIRRWWRGRQTRKSSVTKPKTTKPKTTN